MIPATGSLRGDSCLGLGVGAQIHSGHRLQTVVVAQRVVGVASRERLGAVAADTSSGITQPEASGVVVQGAPAPGVPQVGIGRKAYLFTRRTIVLG